MYPDRLSIRLLVLAAALLPVGGDAFQGLEPEQLALHWQAETAEQARALTQAAWLVLAHHSAPGVLDAEALRRRLELEQLRVRDWQERLPAALPRNGHTGFAPLTAALEASSLILHAHPPDLAETLLPRAADASYLPVLAARWRAGAGERADAIWRELATLTDDDGRAILGGLWNALAGQVEDGVDERSMALARRAREHTVATVDEDAITHARLLMGEAAQHFVDDRALHGVWTLLALSGALSGEPAVAGAVSLQTFVQALLDEHEPRLLQIDPALPTVMAQLSDFAALLAREAAPQQIARPLADAMAQLALFVPDAAFYLDQPVRQGMREGLAACDMPPADSGLLSRERFDDCLQALFDLARMEAGAYELTGDGAGPFASDYLRRELALVSWQRVSFVPGYLDWILETDCPAPGEFNPLEVALAVHLARLASARRPAYARTERWRSLQVALRARFDDEIMRHGRYVDCITGHGVARRDPVTRLLRLYRRELGSLADALRAAERAYRDQVLVADADIRLDAGAGQSTAWRADGLRILPCDTDTACGASAALPASRALVGLFPPPWLVAAQARLGEVALCYDEVRWVDREHRPARRDDGHVSHYYGHLSFDLVGQFRRRDDAPAEVFRMQLTSEERSHYLFASSEPEVLDEPCPRHLIGRRIESELPPGRVRLVPDRLTYFATAPTAPEKLLLANWERGAEWRDWFLTGQNVELLTRSDGADLLPMLDSELARLASEQARVVTGSLLRPPGAHEFDPLTLSMARLSDLKALIRTTMELLYPSVPRYHQAIRAALAGEYALLDRDRARRLRDRGVDVGELAAAGQDRLERLETLWLALPERYRHGGEPSPELVAAIIDLERMLEEQIPSPTGAADERIQPDVPD